MTVLKKSVWIAAAALLVLCLRVNAFRSVDGTRECLAPDMRQFYESGCHEERGWSVSLKFPWRRW